MFGILNILCRKCLKVEVSLRILWGITYVLKANWINKLNALDPQIKFEIKA